jgi:hypothetical protein
MCDVLGRNVITVAATVPESKTRVWTYQIAFDETAIIELTYNRANAAFRTSAAKGKSGFHGVLRMKEIYPFSTF